MEQLDIERARQAHIRVIMGLGASQRRVAVRCVFHNEKSASLILFEDGHYHCFGCGKHGNNAIDFVMDMGYSFSEAVNYIITQT